MIIDVSDRSVVLVCDCGWREITRTRDQARRAAADHEERAHPDRNQSRNVLAAAAYRKHQLTPPCKRD